MSGGGLINLLSSFLAPVSDEVPGEQCRNHSLQYLKALSSGTTWATKMWDSAAKLQTGLLTGNLNSLGNYDECLAVQSSGIEGQDFKGQYCLAKFDIDNGTVNDALGAMFKQVIQTEEEIHVGLGSLLSKGLHWGYCIPSTCNAKDLAVGLSNFLMQHLQSVNVSVHSSDCSYDRSHEQHFSSADLIAVIFVTALFILIITSSCYDCVNVISLFNNDEIYEPDLYTSSAGSSRVHLPQDPETEGQASAASEEQGEVSSLVESELRMTSRNPAPHNSPQSLPEHTAESETVEELEEPQAPAEQPRTRCNWVTPQLSPVKEPSVFERNIYSAFSIFTNGNKLFSLGRKRYSLRTLDGIKVLSLCWVILGQSCFVTSSLPAINYISIKEITSKWPAMLILNTQLAIDSFLVCTGVLTSYHFLRDMNKREIKTKLTNFKERARFFFSYLPIYFLHRYIRLTPAIATMILLQVSVIDHLGSGPFWGTGNGQMSQICHDSWWGTLLYLQNYIDPVRMCLPHSWYMMVDMQLYLISPIVLLIFLYLSKLKALLLSCMLAYVGMMCTFLISYLLYIPAGILPENLEAWHLKIKYEYVTAYTRLAPWIIGMVTGYLLYYFRDEEQKKPAMKSWQLCIGWSVAPLLLGYSIFGLFPFQQHKDEDKKFVSSLFNSVFRSFWALGVAWIIATCETNHGGLLQKFLSLKIFRPLSRLTYCIYLVHLPLMTYRALRIRVPIHIDVMTGLSFVFGDFTASLHYAILLSLFVEMPLIRLFKALTIKLKCPLRAMPYQPFTDESESEGSRDVILEERVENPFEFSSSPRPSRLILTRPLTAPPRNRAEETHPLLNVLRNILRYFPSTTRAQQPAVTGTTQYGTISRRTPQS